MNELGFNKINVEKLIDIIGVDSTIATTTSITTVNLPSAEEYREMANKAAFQFTAQWSEPRYQCPKCGGGCVRI